MLCSMCQHGTTRFIRCGKCGEVVCRHVKCFCQGQKVRLIVFEDWLQARNQSCQMVDRGFDRAPFNRGFYCRMGKARIILWVLVRADGVRDADQTQKAVAGTVLATTGVR